MTEREESYHKGYNTAKSKYQKEITKLKREYNERPIQISSVYPFNLLEDIIEELDNEDKLYSVELLKKTMNTHLTEREQTVLEMMYRRKMTLEEVGKEFNISRERIRQIEVKALRKLRSPTVREKIMCVPITDYIYMIKQVNEWEVKYNELLNRLDSNERVQIEKEVINHDLMKIDIIELELSVRSHNCLMRAGIKTVGDLIDYIKQNKKLYRIRNLGKKSANEILSALENLGIEVTHEN